MEQRILGKTGISVGVLGFGGAEIGFADIDPKEVSSLLNEALDDGLNLIDTAAAYLKSESLIGGALSHRRDEFTLATKCGAVEGFSRSDWSKQGILETVGQSLRNLKTDHVDILLLHSCGELEMSFGQALEGVEAARDKGYTRYIGYSGDGPAALWAVRSGRFDVFETSLNIADQEALSLTLPEARKNNLGIIIKRPIANAAWRYDGLPTHHYHQVYWRRLQELDYSFLSGEQAASIALRFTLGQEGVHTAIVGSSKRGRWRENAENLSAGALPAELVEEIKKRWEAVADKTWVGQI